jgi:hypothetical protein
MKSNKLHEKQGREREKGKPTSDMKAAFGTPLKPDLEALNNPPSQSVQVSNFSQQSCPLSSSSSMLHVWSL